MSKLSGTKWPHSAPTAEPGLLAQKGSKGHLSWPATEGAPVRGPRREDSTPSLILTTRGGRAAQPERQQHPQPSRVQGRHLLGRLRRRLCRRGRSTWGGGPEEEPLLSPSSSYLRLSGSRCAPKLRFNASTPSTANQPIPGRRLSRRPKF